jgi:hypothetical protein
VTEWKVGDTFRTPDGRRLRIVQIIDRCDLVRLNLDAETVHEGAWMVEAFEPA